MTGGTFDRDFKALFVAIMTWFTCGAILEWACGRSATVETRGTRVGVRVSRAEWAVITARTQTHRCTQTFGVTITALRTLLALWHLPKEMRIILCLYVIYVYMLCYCLYVKRQKTWYQNTNFHQQQMCIMHYESLYESLYLFVKTQQFFHKFFSKNCAYNYHLNLKFYLFKACMGVERAVRTGHRAGVHIAFRAVMSRATLVVEEIGRTEHASRTLGACGTHTVWQHVGLTGGIQLAVVTLLTARACHRSTVRVVTCQGQKVERSDTTTHVLFISQLVTHTMDKEH